MEPRNELGTAYRALVIETDQMERTWNEGQLRYSKAEIGHKLNAIEEIKKLLTKEKELLEKFNSIAS